ncbi:hypothetical protein ACIRPH_08440 [Nocardiopsis sp. NPDC101807]|uniref:hypothetical protein n=1 Tax=Nocardiopsis sp. NPDC101807 TaxID=3364339 RepID=UPI0037FD4A84
MTRPGGAVPGPFNAVVLLLAVLVVWLGAASVERVARAASADGEPGTFTASRVECVSHLGHESCTCYGTHVPDDGGTAREDVYLHGADRASCVTGAETPSYDVGSATRVYGPEGSREWLFTAGMILAGAALGVWASRPWWPRRGRAA